MEVPVKRIGVPIFIMLFLLVPHAGSYGFHEVALKGGSGITEGYAERYGTADAAGNHHAVWLYTRAACDSIRWTLGETMHGGSLTCGAATGFVGVPEGVHHVVIEGCGKRIAAYLSVKSDLHLMIEPADLSAGGRCQDGNSPGEGISHYVDFVESLGSISIIFPL
jgi:hypothetical protein